MRSKLLTLFVLSATVSAAQQTSPSGNGDTVLITREEVTAPPLIIYPNPSSGTLTVNWGGRPLYRMPVEVRTTSGRLVIMDSLSPENELDVSVLPDGTYQLFLLDRRGVLAQRAFRIAR